MDPQKRVGVLLPGPLVRGTRSGQQVCKAPEGAEGQPSPAEVPWCWGHTAGSGGPRFDHQGMVLPHSILGNLQDYKSYLKTIGKADVERASLVRKVPETTREDLPGASWSPAAGGQAGRVGAEESGRAPHTQSHALQHWSTHMRQRRRQQDSLAKSLCRPKDWLLMNRANRFRAVKEQREMLSLVLPAIQPGHGYRVGSEFWSLPERLGDEVGGLTFTLNRTQRGQRVPVVRVGQPRTIQHESGNVLSETCGPASKAWGQSEYLQEQQQQIQQVLKELDLEAPNMDGLEVIGSGGPLVHPNHLPEDEEALEQTVPEKRDPGEQDDDDDDDDVDETGSVTPVPALTFCGQSVQWTPSQGQPGISSRMGFDVVNVGETARSHLLLRNRGNAAVYYTWQRLELPRCFAGPPGTAAAAWQTQTATHFYFNSSMGVILPSETQQVEVLFKSDTPGIKCELWQLNTHPVLLGGATVQVTMRGVALDRDTNAHHRLVLERELEKKVTVKVCQSLVYEVLRGVASPERPSSPAELYITEDQEFLRKNPKLQYAPGPVEALQRLWQSAAPGAGGWDLSVETLRQAVLSLPEEDPGPRGTHCTLTREQGLARLNSTLLELPQHPFTSVPITAATVGRQLWRELLDGLAGEASRLRHLLGLPETDTWSQPSRDPVTPDIVLEDEGMKEKGEWKGGAKAKEDGRGASKSPAKDRATKKARAGEEVTPGGRRAEEPSLADASRGPIGHTPCDDSQANVQPEMMHKYRTLLKQKVVVLMEELVSSFLDALGEEE